MATLSVVSSNTTGADASGDTIFDWLMHVPFALAKRALQAASPDAHAGSAMATVIAAALKTVFLIHIPLIRIRGGRIAVHRGQKTASQEVPYIDNIDRIFAEDINRVIKEAMTLLCETKLGEVCLFENEKA